MKKIKKYVIPITVLILFVAIMKSGGFLKKPFSDKDDVLASIEALKKDIIDENWEQAEIDFEKLKTSWKIVEKRIQFSVERDEMHLIDISIARIEGALLIHDRSFAIMELSEIMEHWDSLEK
ncbi:DUF4363 family protein [Desnuesiella massiliensis]|uniref:DUF4363 family protein n=1 Tax=Desnuesiella massiliensis TaxID=1650662 RepID=UPI0006E3945C|nr:DUF4363 family protein [Desnuesiella massiliensis]